MVLFIVMETSEPRVEVARFVGQVSKVQTAVDGGFRIWLDGGNQDIVTAAYLMPFATTPGALVEVVFYQMPIKEAENVISRKKAKKRKP